MQILQTVSPGLLENALAFSVRWQSLSLQVFLNHDSIRLCPWRKIFDPDNLCLIIPLS